MAGLREFVVQFGTEEQCIEHLAGLRWPGGFADLPSAGIGDRWNGVSPDTNRSDQVVSCRLSDGPR